MNKYNQEYQKRKQKVIRLLTESAQQLRAERQEQEAKSMEELCENIRKDLFSIVVVGEFSAGKSTFLNAMMHKAVLPSFTTETTATVNFLRHKDQGELGQAGVVYYREPEGKTQVLTELSRETLDMVVSTRGNREGQPTVAQTVDHVDLFLDSNFLKDGVMLVDSPGLNGIEDHHREITEHQIQKSHACIFVFSADHAGTRTDFEVLRELQSQVSNIFLVLNKIDVIRSGERETPELVIQKLKDNYKQIFPEALTIPPIWPVSARNALEARDPDYSVGTLAPNVHDLEKMSRMGAFEDRLWKYLTQGERARDQLLNPVRQVKWVLERERQRLDNHRKLLSQETGIEELIEHRQDLERVIEEYKRKGRENTAEVKKGVRKAIQDLKTTASKECEQISRRLGEQLDVIQTLEEMKNSRRELEETLNKRLKKIAEDLDQKLRDIILNLVEEQYEQYRDQLEEKLESDSEEEVFRFELASLSLSEEQSRINLEQFEREAVALSKEIEELEAQIDQNDEDIMRAKIRERNLEDKRKELKELQESRNEYQQNFVIPEYIARDVTRTGKEKRGGLVGVIGNVLFGKKTVQYQETVDNRDVIERSKKELEEGLKPFDQQIVETRRQITVMEKMEKNADGSEILKSRKQKIVKRYQDKTQENEKRQEDFRAQMENENKASLLKHRKEISRQIEDSCENFCNQVEKYLKQRKSIYQNMVNKLVNMNLNQELERQQKELNDVIHMIEEKGDQRKRNLEQVTEQIERLNELISRGIELEDELDHNMEDHLEQEELINERSV